jgi:hypothetical protein
MRVLSTAATMFLAAATLGSTVSLVQAQSCGQLWVERNSYYKNHGYCFKTAKAIGHFGNAGCRYNSEAAVPLSSRERARIAEITRLERRNGCND